MDAILYPAQLQRALACLVVITPDDERQGTGFLVTSTRLLTAYHVVEQATSIQVEFRYAEKVYRTAGRVIASPELAAYDLAIVELESALSNVEPLPLSTVEPRVGARWETSGFPQPHALTGRPYRGRVLQKNLQVDWPLTLAVEGGNSVDNLTGLSGSPLVVDDQVCGLIRVQLEQDIGAMLLAPVADVLRELGLSVHEETARDQPLPEEEELVPNQAVINELRATLTEASTGWHALVGSPGSGKTTLVATLEPAERQAFVVGGRYYLSRAGSALLPSLAAGRERLLQWLNDTASILMTGERAPAPEPDQSFEEQLRRCHDRLAQLGWHFQQQQKTVVLVIDGLDETVPEPQRHEFLGVLPLTLPSGLAIVLSATGLEVLSAPIRTQLSPTLIVNVTPLPAQHCEEYLHKRLPQLPASQAALLAERSEGHPLYLQYLIRQVELRQAEGEDNADWLADIPQIGGEIQHYYERIWPVLAANPAQLQLVLTIAALRGPVSRSELYYLLPAFAQQEFEAALPKVAYLLKNTVQVSLYHASFAQFVRENATQRLRQVQDTICKYIEANPAWPYAFVNQVYHWVYSSTPARAIQACTQEWADACARQHVAPDTLLDDVRLAKQMAIEASDLTQVVRLHLLHVRMAFRYNELMGAYAAVLANALLALGQPDAALNYLLRGEILQVTENDALLLVQQFYEAGAEREGAYLLNYLRRRASRLLDEEMREGSLSWEVLKLFYSSNTLFAYEDTKASIDVFTRGIHSLTQIQEDFAEDSQDYQAIQVMKNRIMGYHGGFILWAFDHYALPIRFYEEHPEYSRVMRPADAGKWATIAQTALDFQSNNPRQPFPSKLVDVVQDVTLLTRKYGYLEQDLSRILFLLMEQDGDPQVVQELAPACLKLLAIPALRTANGVDLQPNYLSLVVQRALLTGYTSSIGEGYKSLPLPYPGAEAWEEFVASLITHLGYLRGQLLRLRAENQAPRYGELLAQAQAADAALNLTLGNRSQWERSYALPEAVFPVAYELLAGIYITFYPAEVSRWVGALTRRASGQAGLYTEGFRECYFRVAQVLRRDSSFRLVRYQVLESLRLHVLAGVHNRWERTGALLELIEHYADNGNQARSLASYDELLATSMGPAWYKEDQFALAPAIVRHLPAASQVVPTLAALVDAAAGEMTFQRYVRDTKAQLVGALAQQGRIDLAIAYYQFETLPDPGTVRANALLLATDAVQPGDGYALGARSLVEASALAEMLCNLPMVDPRLSWACAQVFSRNEDTWRFAREYGKLQGEAFNRLLAEHPTETAALQSEWVAGLQAGRFTKRELKEYLPAFGKALTNEAHQRIETALAVNPGWQKMIKRTPDPPPQQRLADEELITGWPGMGRPDRYRAIEEQLRVAAEEAEMGDQQRAGRMLGEYATTLWQEGWSIWWAENLSRELGQLMTKTVEYTETTSGLLRALRQPIAHSTEWNVAQKLLEWSAPRLGKVEQQQLAEALTDHLQAVTQPAAAALHKYAWLAKPTEQKLSTEQQMVKLLIWHLVHPNAEWRQVSAITLIRLAVQLPSLVISGLLDVALAPQYTGAWHEAAASLLPHIARVYPLALWNVVAQEIDLAGRVKHVRHLLIQHDVQQALETVVKVMPDARPLLQQIQDTVPASGLLTGRISTAEVALDEEYLAFIQYELEELNARRWLSKELCQELLSTLAGLCHPLTITEVWEADRYVQRSFMPNKPFLLPFQARLTYALNQAVMYRAHQRDWNELVNILRPD